MNMEVSVIIPVYNAEKYVALAIDSALAQEETSEVILVEDNSPDNALLICEQYALRDQRVVVLRHPDGKNHGAGASFNLGIRHARFPFIAFLGADDQFVAGRFASAKKIFETHPEANGAYAHIGVVYYDPQYKVLHLKRIPKEITGMHVQINPEVLLCRLLSGKQGHISLDALVVRREILTTQFLFDESLRLGQDTDFLYRLAGVYRFYGTEHVEIVALRGVHAGNRVFNFDEANKYHRQVLKKCIRNKYYGCKDKEAVTAVIKRYLQKSGEYRLPYLPVKIKHRLAFYLFLLTHPGVGLHYLSL